MTHQIYNTLPSIFEADRAFQDRKPTFDQCAKLLAQYDYTWGVRLVHRHCALEQGEVMLGKGYISSPITLASCAETMYPESFLATGEVYEYTTRRTQSPPEPLLRRFREILEARGLAGVLGLYHVDKNETARHLVERTEGRTNILEPGELSDKVVETTWDFGHPEDPDACYQSCNPDGMGGHRTDHYIY